jgi:NADH dehydrogenase/NADH:ubiquinone oxidoreductase subunit G
MDRSINCGAGLCTRRRRSARTNQFAPADGSPALVSEAAECLANPLRCGQDFYLTNPIARASHIMAECSALRHHQQLQAAE